MKKELTKPDELPYINGCVEDAPDPRDYIYEEVMGAPPVDMPTFEQGYDSEEKYGILNNDDQGSTLSCVGQGSSNDTEMDYLITRGKKIHLSARYIYAQIHLPNGGATPRDAYKLMKDKGVCEYDLLPSRNAQGAITETFMRTLPQDTTEIDKNAAQYKIGNYYNILTYELPVFAQAIFTNGGVGGGYKGFNANIGHFIFFKGYGVHKGYWGLKYKDSIPTWEIGKKTFDKWIIKHNNKFYLDSPSGTQVQLYSHWTFEHGDYPVDPTIVKLERKKDKPEVFLTIGGERYWIKDLSDFNNLKEGQPIEDIAWSNVQEVDEFTTPYSGKIIGEANFIDALKNLFGSIK